MKNGNPAIYGTVSVGTYIVNDYVLTIEETDNGYTLTIKKGTEEQEVSILNGAKGDKGDRGDPGVRITVTGTNMLIEPSISISVEGANLIIS